MDDNGLPNDGAAFRKLAEGVHEVRDGRGKPRRCGGEHNDPLVGLGQKEDQTGHGRKELTRGGPDGV